MKRRRALLASNPIRSWREVVYEVSRQTHLFEESEEVKVEDANEKIANAYRDRLGKVAGFSFVPAPLRFIKIVEQIFQEHLRKQGL